MQENLPVLIIPLAFWVASAIDCLINLWLLDKKLKIVKNYDVTKTFKLKKSRIFFIFNKRKEGVISKKIFWYHIIFYIVSVNFWIFYTLISLNISLLVLPLALVGTIPIVLLAFVLHWHDGIMGYNKKVVKTENEIHFPYPTVTDSPSTQNSVAGCSDSDSLVSSTEHIDITSLDSTE